MLVNQIGAYCGPNPSKPGRFLAKIELIYSIHDQFADRNIDSGLCCPGTADVIVNVVLANALL